MRKFLAVFGGGGGEGGGGGGGARGVGGRARNAPGPRPAQPGFFRRLLNAGRGAITGGIRGARRGFAAGVAR